MPHYLPLTELPQSPQKEALVGWQVDPGPSINPDEIGLQVDETRSLIRRAGLGGIIIKDYVGEKTEYTTSITGVNGLYTDGSASATGSASGSPVESQQTSLLPDKGYGFTKRPTAVIAINKSEIASQVSTEKSRGRTHNEAWTRCVGKAITAGVVSAAKEHLITEALESSPPYLLSFLMAETSAAISGSPAHVANIGALMYVSIVCGTLIAERIMEGRSKWRDLHLGVIPAPFQPDRFAWTCLQARMTRPLTPIPTGKQ